MLRGAEGTQQDKCHFGHTDKRTDRLNKIIYQLITLKIENPPPVLPQTLPGLVNRVTVITFESTRLNVVGLYVVPDVDFVSRRLKQRQS